MVGALLSPLSVAAQDSPANTTQQIVQSSGDQNSSSFKLPADVAWFDTKIDLTSGQSVTITASGTVTVGALIPANNVETPAGKPALAGTERMGGELVAQGLAPWSLVGKIGSGKPFEVGTSLTFTATASGRLYLCCNDNNFFDNGGSWNVTVTGGTKVSQPTQNSGQTTTSTTTSSGSQSTSTATPTSNGSANSTPNSFARFMASSAYSQALAQFDSGQSQFPGIQHLAQLTGDFIHSLSIYLVNANGTVGQLEFDAQVLKNSSSILPISEDDLNLAIQNLANPGALAPAALDAYRNIQFALFVGPQLYNLLTSSQSPSKADVENIFALIGFYAGAAEAVPIAVQSQVVPDVSGSHISLWAIRAILWRGTARSTNNIRREKRYGLLRRFHRADTLRFCRGSLR